MTLDNELDFASLSAAEQRELRRLLLAEEGFEAAEPQRQITPLADDAPPPLSFAQHGIWLASLLSPASPLYNVPVVVRMTGALDVGALQQALNQLVRRH